MERSANNIFSARRLYMSVSLNYVELKKLLPDKLQEL